jgi:transposase
MPRKQGVDHRTGEIKPGLVAKGAEQTLRSYSVGALPIINRFLQRIDLENILRQHLRADRRQMKLPTVKGLMLVVRNLLMSREPLYGIAEWAQRYAPDLLGLKAQHLKYLNDDRIGRCTDRLFESEESGLVMAVVRYVIQKFNLSLDELHNDSTTVSFFGAYEEAAEEGVHRDRKTIALTYGNSKDHRPDLKQLLYTLTVTDDGGVPVYFTTHSGNTVDDNTHQQTWDVMKQLVGSADFLYVADCKLASTENMKYIARQNGRFISVLPATRKEDQEFRERHAADPDSVVWNLQYEILDDYQKVVDQLSVCPQEVVTKEKFRLWWFHSTRKAQLDHRRRLQHIQRATVELTKLRDRLLGPRPRLRSKDQIDPLVSKILQDTESEGLLQVEVLEYEAEQYRQAKPGRPGKNTKYVKHTHPFCDLMWEVDNDSVAKLQKSDGIFPLITNAVEMSAYDVLCAYKRQPIIEKRFSQLKTDFEVAPMYLKNVTRIQAMMCLYFFTLLIQTLLERELRKVMKAADLEALPLYPEGRACAAPTTRRIIDIFEPIQRHTLTTGTRSETFVTELSPLQRQILKLLGMSPKDYGM